MDWLWAIVGSALGGMARYAVSGAIARRIGETFPWGTLIVNISGALVIGVFAALTAPRGALAGHTSTALFVMTGLCGGYTTFSSFGLQTLNLTRDGDWRRAGLNVVGSAALCLVAVAAGFAVGAFISRG